MLHFDIAIIGGGVVGCAIAMELSRYDLRTVLLEARSDVGAATSKANSAILHTGFDAPPDSLEATLVSRGYELFHQMSEPLGLPICRSGALVVAWNEEQTALLPGIRDKAERNKVPTYSVSEEELRLLEPHLNQEALAAIMVPGESITCPFTPVVAFATNAVLNGVTLLREFPVQSAERIANAYRLCGPSGEVQAHVVINAAGLWSDDTDHLFGKQVFSVRPRKGEFLIFDKPAARLINHIVLPAPTARTKGVLMTKTAFGNLLLGPTAIDVDDKTDTAVSAGSIAHLLEIGCRMLPRLRSEDVTCSYAGLRAATQYADYQIHFYPEDRLVTVGGIRSTGLSASLGIAEYVAGRVMTSYGLSHERKSQWTSQPAPPITEFATRKCESKADLAKNPDYGAIVCHCERVSKGEIEDAFHGPVPPRDLDALKRRTRAMMGRCQGFNCHERLSAILHEHRQA
jgi:glycerol-3-phosphate dehydrogenase